MSFLDEKYLLESDAAVSIYNAVKDLPIIDPHNHADVAEIAANGTYSDAWQVFAATDHYVWEVMRKRGVEESRITGSASAKEKWMELARVMPEIAGNPVFEWIHLDLRRRFGIMDVLCADNAERIWNEVNDKLATDAFRPLALLNAMNVEVMCSTDDPVDLLEEHEKVNQKAGRTLIRPTWRPDKAMRIHYPGFRDYIARLGKLRCIQKVAAKLFSSIRIVFGKMLRGLDGALVKVGHVHIGDLRFNLDRRHQQNARTRRSVGPRKRADGANQRHGATGDIGSCHVKDRLTVVGAQHDHNGVQRLMSLEQHRQRADAVEISVQMAHVVAYRRAAVEAFFNYMPALA